MNQLEQVVQAVAAILGHRRSRPPRPARDDDTVDLGIAIFGRPKGRPPLPLERPSSMRHATLRSSATSEGGRHYVVDQRVSVEQRLAILGR
ncbi:hypothetical protein [Kitasatospora purpeofusca]|uniref:hypothetical protein n=1 Tax=Kitasatospora purpeofusca TaxID=67352 RepID=UPI004062CD7C